jgi:hypothetical protein
MHALFEDESQWFLRAPEPKEPTATLLRCSAVIAVAASTKRRNRRDYRILRQIGGAQASGGGEGGIFRPALPIPLIFLTALARARRELVRCRALFQHLLESQCASHHCDDAPTLSFSGKADILCR